MTTAVERPDLRTIPDEYSNTTIGIKWDAIPLAAGYQSRFITKTDESPIRDVSDTHFTFSGLDPGKNYRVQVRAVGKDSIPSSEWSEIELFTRANSPEIEIARLGADFVSLNISNVKQFDQISYSIVQFWDVYEAPL